MDFVMTPDAPTPAGHYSQAAVHAGIVYVSGQLPIDAASGRPVHGTIEEQTQLALANVEAILRAARSSRDRVIKSTVYVSDVALWGRVNAVYAEFFGDHRPARVVVPTRDLHHGLLIEVDVIAAVADRDDGPA